MKLFENPITARIFYVIFSCPIMVLEEIMFAYETLQRSRRLLSLMPCITIKKTSTFCGVKCLPISTGLTTFDNIPETANISIISKDQPVSVQSQSMFNFGGLSLNPSQSRFVESVNVCKELTVWYTHIWDDVKRKLQLVLLENGNQFTYQTAKLIFENFYPNLMDARYDNRVSMFRLQTGVTIFSIALSVYSIFTPVLNRECILLCMQRKRVPNPMFYVLKCMQLIIHMALSTGSVLLLGSTSYSL